MGKEGLGSGFKVWVSLRQFEGLLNSHASASPVGKSLVRWTAVVPGKCGQASHPGAKAQGPVSVLLGSECLPDKNHTPPSAWPALVVLGTYFLFCPHEEFRVRLPLILIVSPGSSSFHIGNLCELGDIVISMKGAGQFQAENLGGRDEACFTEG